MIKMSVKLSGELFESFWDKKGRYRLKENAERFRENLEKKIEELGTVDALDDYVCGLGTGRESTRQVVVEFYKYLLDEGKCKELDSCLFEKKFYDYPFERQLEIAKFLHEPKTPKEIEEKFDIDERTRRKDLQALEEGISVLGSTIQIKKEKKGRSYYYKTTLHPIFLPLNLTEVYALTVYLERVIPHDDVNGELIHNIAERIKIQLSDYAFDRLFPNEERHLYGNRYLDDEYLANQRDGIQMYLMKSGSGCKFLWNDTEYYGRIVWEEGKYKIKLEDGSILDADLDDVEFVIESLQYQ